MPRIKYTSLFNLRNEHGRVPTSVLVAILSVLVLAAYGSMHSVISHANSLNPPIKSGVLGNCLDVVDNSNRVGAIVDNYGCNNTDAQLWTTTYIHLIHDKLCLNANGLSRGSEIDLNNCSNSPNEVWLPDKQMLYNPASQLCLTDPNSQTGVNLTLSDCLNKSNQSWSSPILDINCSSYSDRANLVACNAVKQWQIWQSGSINHNNLLNTYTDGAPYEEWCADFVSYIYKSAGYPFTGGETNGWDENNANNIINMGFREEDPGSYLPKPGDVAYFSYNGGHVEIVIDGGSQPTYLYGNSGKTDPTTGNGEMAANTLTSDGDLGSLVYYLTP